MALSEIEKLERRYAENPQGLTFAPLAEVHRKMGDVARALELLRPGLELHPDYIPASIVLGRCHFDLGDLPAAETAFTHVLALDGENVIALKALADIHERLHHFDEAERRLQALLSVDRSNDDARTQLERIEAARQNALAAPAPPELDAGPTPAEPAAAEPAAAAGEQPGGEVETAANTETPAAAAESPEPAPAWVPELEPAAVEEESPLALPDLEPSLVADDAIEPPPPGLEIDEPEHLEEPVEPIAGLIGRDLDQVELEEAEFRVETSEDIVLRSSGGQEFQVPDASEELSARVPQPLPSPFGEEPAPGFGSLEEPPVTPPAPQPSPEPLPVAERLPEPEPPAEPEPEPVAVRDVPPEPVPAEAAATVSPVPEVVVPEPELVVTETMAEVLLQQGHPTEALRVYRELEVRGPGDERLRQKIAELEDEGRSEPEPAAARRSYSAADTGGQSVGDFFRAMLAARPPATAGGAPAASRGVPAPPAPAEGSGAPTRPAADALSLSSVFGDESSPLPPAMPAAGPAPAAGVSFDEFYSPPGSAGASKARGPDPKNDDLDQFHAWLQNLKR